MPTMRSFARPRDIQTNRVNLCGKSVYGILTYMTYIRFPTCKYTNPMDPIGVIWMPFCLNNYVTCQTNRENIPDR